MGIDVAQAQWDMALRPSGGRGAVQNDASGVATLVARVQALKPPLLGLAATGGLARAGTSARAVARATGHRATTDACEARALAHVADVIRPTPRPLPDAQTQALRALLGRRQPLRGRRTAEPHRLAGTHARLVTDIEAHSPWIHTRLATLEEDLETALRASPLWRDNDELLQRAKGMGPVCARTLLGELPALGTLTRQQIAA